ncbi:restriction endonuclease subunit S [Comamonas sp. C11]|uniref:restriction endonuclease subunit S n=1 Tax=Comamonas sp. C11 TaxID=2966554 RepID=UPI0021133637|nr:restriction endonuclease subunit S [Comamonas sp. C11]UUC94376.1 restriction endonuclease subunit S [Comamonas sp. C11]
MSRPQKWETIPLRYVCELNPSVAFDGLDEDEDLTFLPMDRVKSGYFIANTSKFSKYGASYTAFEDGDIVLAKVTPCFENGNIAIADNLVGGKGFGSSELFVIRPTAAERRFLFYYFQSSTFKQDGEASMTGAGGLKRVSTDVLRQHHLPCPSRDDQRRIASYLDRETARIDGLVTEKERMLALLEEKHAALINRIVTRGLDPNAPLKRSGQAWLGEIPAHWATCQLKRTWASSDYGLSESIRDEGDIAVLRMSCIVNGRIDVSKSGMIADVDDHLLLRRNDLLFNRTNSLDQIAKVGLVDFDPDEPLTFASYLVRIRANHRATPQYLVALLNSSLFLEFARKNAIPAIGQANLSPTRYGEIHIPLPPKAEQDEIVTFLERDAATSTPVREHISSSISLLKERRAALISAAVTGQIPLEEMSG